MKYRVKYVACDFTDKDKNGHMSFDKQSVVDYLALPRTIDRIKNKKLIGALSHLARDEYQKYIDDTNNPSVGDQSDFLLAKGYAANVITQMYIKSDKLYIVIETLPTENGILLAKMYNDGFNLSVSLATELDVGDKYYLHEIFGLDITNSPAFNTTLVEKEAV